MRRSTVKAQRAKKRIKKAQNEGRYVKVRNLSEPKDLNDKFYWYSQAPDESST